MQITRLPLIIVSIALSLASTGVAARAATLASPADHATDRAGNAMAKTDLIALATDEEVYLTDVGTHYGSFARLRHDGQKVKVGRGVQLKIVHVDGSTGYCLRAEQADDGYREFYDSGAGGLRRRPCSAITASVFLLVTAEEIYDTDNNTYASVKQLRQAGDTQPVGPHIRLAVVWYDVNSYCIRGTERTSSSWWGSRHGGHKHPCGPRPKGAKRGGSY